MKFNKHEHLLSDNEYRFEKTYFELQGWAELFNDKSWRFTKIDNYRWMVRPVEFIDIEDLIELFGCEED